MPKKKRILLAKKTSVVARTKGRSSGSQNVVMSQHQAHGRRLTKLEQWRKEVQAVLDRIGIPVVPSAPPAPPQPPSSSAGPGLEGGNR